MTTYLDYTFDDNETFIHTFDELPLWSASFGLLMLKHLEMKPAMTVIDIGSGAGFPLMELASRLGTSCKLYGIDPWVNANERARLKIKNYGLTNVEIIETSAAQIPFENDSTDLIVSNLGINNFENPQAVFNECCRVLKPGGKLALTTNINGHWKEFYTLFESTLRQLDKAHHLPALQNEQEHRGSIASISDLFAKSGLNVCRSYQDRFEMRFLDGSAFLNHHFVKLGWLGSWLALFPKEELPVIFSALEENLNAYAKANNGLTFTVPMAYIEGVK